MIDQKIITKLQKLLALSASDNENEAALAMQKAEELMREHNLSVADVALDGSGADVDTTEIEGSTKNQQKWEMSLGAIITYSFNGKVVVSKNGNGWKFTFVAGRTDLAIITDLFARLRSTIKRMSKAYVDANRATSVNRDISSKTLHNSYRLGLINTINSRLKSLKENTAPDHNLNVYGKTGTDLMVIKDRAVNQFFYKLFPQTKKITNQSQPNLW